MERARGVGALRWLGPAPCPVSSVRCILTPRPLPPPLHPYLAKDMKKSRNRELAEVFESGEMPRLAFVLAFMLGGLRMARARAVPPPATPAPRVCAQAGQPHALCWDPRPS